MRSTFLSRTRKWIGASALAILVGVGGGTAFLAASSPSAIAQFQQAAQITLPTEATPNSFADLVEAVKPAVVSIVVEGDEANRSLQAESRHLRRLFEQAPASSASCAGATTSSRSPTPPISSWWATARSSASPCARRCRR